MYVYLSAHFRIPQISHILWNHTSSPWVTTTHSTSVQTYDGTEQVVFVTGPWSSMCYSAPNVTWSWFLWHLIQAKSKVRSDSCSWHFFTCLCFRVLVHDPSVAPAHTHAPRSAFLHVPMQPPTSLLGSPTPSCLTAYMVLGLWKQQGF